MEYLINRRGKKKKAHIFIQGDTACRMLSTGGLKRENYFVVTEVFSKTTVCHMCEVNYEQLSAFARGS